MNDYKFRARYRCAYCDLSSREGKRKLHARLYFSTPTSKRSSTFGRRCCDLTSEKTDVKRNFRAVGDRGRERWRDSLGNRSRKTVTDMSRDAAKRNLITGFCTFECENTGNA